MVWNQNSSFNILEVYLYFNSVEYSYPEKQGCKNGSDQILVARSLILKFPPCVWLLVWKGNRNLGGSPLCQTFHLKGKGWAHVMESVNFLCPLINPTIKCPWEWNFPYFPSTVIFFPSPTANHALRGNFLTRKYSDHLTLLENILVVIRSKLSELSSALYQLGIFNVCILCASLR